VRRLAGTGFAIAMLGLLEAVAMSKAIANRTGQKLDINQQCLSEGAANMAGSFFQCIPGSGSLTRSAINQQAGAVSQWSGVFSAVAVAGTVLLFAPLAQFIPQSSLAGLLLLAGFRMVDGRQVLFHFRATRFDAGVVLATALAAVLISVEFCMVIGVFLSFVLYIPRAAQVRFTPLSRTRESGVQEQQPTGPRCDRLVLYSVEGDLFFGAEPELQNQLLAIVEEARGKVQVVLLDLERARNPDAAFLILLNGFYRRLQQRQVALVLSGVQADLSHALERTGLDLRIGTARIFRNQPGNGASTPNAVQYAYTLLGENLCSTCPRSQDLAGTYAPLNYVI
jgi:SulP family sulfate permease